MSKRETLHLNPRQQSPAPADARDPLAELLDQPSGIDPHNPHKLVQPSQTVIPDLERLAQILEVFRRHAIGAKGLSPRAADQMKHEASSLVAKIGNAASANAVDRD